jgi:hypothetical protein
MKNSKISEKLKNVFFSLKKNVIFFTYFKKIFGHFMIKFRKTSKKTLGSKFRKKSHFMQFLIKTTFLNI